MFGWVLHTTECGGKKVPGSSTCKMKNIISKEQTHIAMDLFTSIRISVKSGCRRRGLPGRSFGFDQAVLQTPLVP
jgi:hypothetical protein